MSEHAPNQPVVLTVDELRKLAHDVVERTLTSFGIDVENPLEVQKDFARLREWRTAMDAMQRRGLMVVAGFLVSGLLAAIVIGVKENLRRLIH